jgi:acetylornithine deacetylase/succinyl-diaminopimelate desuccinylase-like protein
MTTLNESIDTYLQTNLDRYITETIRLCAQPSISARGEGVRECADLVAELFTQHGLQMQKFETPGNPIIVGRLSGRSPRTLLFYNHYDVQPPEPLEEWTSLPFQPTLRDGMLFARGVGDDKGELIARLAAMDAVRAAHGGELPCGVVFVAEGEEEVGSHNIAAFVREHIDLLKCNGAVWEGGGVSEEGGTGTTLGLRGVLNVELEVQLMTMDAHSGGAHIFPSSVWRLIRALVSIKDEHERILIPGFYDQVKPPTELDLQLLDAQPDHEARMREMLGIREFVNGLTGKDLGRAVFNPTCNIQGFTAGYQGPGSKTIVPARASAKVDFRLVPDQDPVDILEKLRRHLDSQGFTDVTVTKKGAMWPFKASADDPFIAMAKRIGEELYQQPYRINPLGGGSSPEYAFASPLGNIPIIDAGVGYFNGRGHAPDENIRLADFLTGSIYLAHILNEFASLDYGKL